MILLLGISLIIIAIVIIVLVVKYPEKGFDFYISLRWIALALACATGGVKFIYDYFK
jgi:hypothetical protein